MKVVFSSSKITPVGSIPVGTPFIAERKSEKGKGLYMKIDKSSGLIKTQSPKGSYDAVYAVNLETGQLREFVWTAGIEVAEAQIVCE